ncbi:MAG: MiaB/RimO family radical SAM methylthiotransferase [Acidobacteriaceae bacterium]
MVGYHVENFGCRTSQADGDAIAAGLEALGAGAAGRLHADVVVVNTCTVTAEADRDARAYIRRVLRANPKARVVVTGCYAQRAPEEVAALPGVVAVAGNSHKGRVASISMQAVQTGQVSSAPGFIPLAALAGRSSRSAGFAVGTPAHVLADDIFAHTEIELPSIPVSAMHRTGNSSGQRTRPSLKIQDGCGNRCTFCVIPSVRGNSRSLARDKVLRSVQDFVDAGGKELVLSGINLGRWGRDLVPQSRLEDMLEGIFENTKLPRLRISSVEPMDWTEAMNARLRRWASGQHPRLARHVHLPLQSGSDGVLRRMHRRYRPWHYAERLAAVRASSPDAAIGADVMIGFPGESDAEFQESYDFIAVQPFTYLHLFPFSARPGTPGWELHSRQPVEGTVVRERMAALRSLMERKNLAFRSSFVGRELSAVTLCSDSAAVELQGAALTDNFLPVELEGAWPANTLLSIFITGVGVTGLHGMAASYMDSATRPGRLQLHPSM